MISTKAKREEAKKKYILHKYANFWGAKKEPEENTINRDTKMKMWMRKEGRRKWDGNGGQQGTNPKHHKYVMQIDFSDPFLILSSVLMFPLLILSTLV